MTEHAREHDSGPQYADGRRTSKGKRDPSLLAVVAESRGVRTLIRLPIEPQAQLSAMKEIVGGFLEAVTLDTEPTMIMWCNEDGHALDLPPNAFATLIAIAHTRVVLGNIILTGGPDANGDITELAHKWIQTLV